MKWFDRILEDFGWPRIYLVSVRQFEELEGWTPKPDWGGAGEKYPIICFTGKPYHRQKRNIVIHEILHKLFPDAEEWWVEGAAEKLTPGGGRGEWMKESGHTLDEIPDVDKLWKMCLCATKKWNKRKRRT